jgi:bifunctional non-homologous end joining protein LigD
MKAKLVDSMRPEDRIYEIKFDGYRALALRGGSETRILSRNQNDLGSKFPEVKASTIVPPIALRSQAQFLHYVVNMWLIAA